MGNCWDKSCASSPTPVQFMAQERTVVDEAYSGDIVGLSERVDTRRHVGIALRVGEFVTLEPRAA